MLSSLLFYVKMKKKWGNNMTEKEKMLSQQWHLPSDNELSQMRLETSKLLYQYNLCAPDDEKNKAKLISQILGSAGKKPHFVPPFHCDYGQNIHIGDWFFANTDCTILDSGEVFIGDEVLFGPHVSLYTVMHPMDFESRKKAYEKAKPIYIEDGVWLGGNVIVLAGVRIGARSVIGAGSVVTKDIPADSFAVGNPCKVIRKIDQNQRTIS